MPNNDPLICVNIPFGDEMAVEPVIRVKFAYSPLILPVMVLLVSVCEPVRVANCDKATPPSRPAFVANAAVIGYEEAVFIVPGANAAVVAYAAVVANAAVVAYAAEVAVEAESEFTAYAAVIA